MRRLIASLVVALVASVPVHTSAQAKARTPGPAPAPVTIVVGSLMLHLGMGQAETLRLLETSYDVTRAHGQSDSFALRAKRPSGEAVGSIAFADGRLALVSRQGTAPDYATGVLEALRSVSGSASCSIAETKAGEALLMKVVCGQRTVEVSGGGAAGNAATVSETVRSR